MKSKLGMSISSSSTHVVYMQGDVKPQILDAFVVPLAVSNIFGNLTIDEEKQLIKTAGIIKSTLKTKKMLEGELFVTIPDEYCSLRILRLPLVSEKEILSAIELQAEEFIPYPVEEANFDYQILATDEKEREMSVLVVATYKKIVERLSNFILDCGIYPNILEPQSAAMIRMFFNGYFLVQGDLILLANIGEKSTQTAILDIKNKQILMMHDFSLGTNFFVKAIQGNLNIPLEDAQKQFAEIKLDSDLYSKIVAPLFIEFSKEIQKILIASTDKINLMPKSLYVLESDLVGSIAHLFRNSTLLINSQTYEITPALLDAKAPLQFAPAIDKSKLTPFVMAVATLM